MSKFFVPKRVDPTLASEGIWIGVDEADDSYGEYKLKFLDHNTREGEQAFKRLRQKYAAQLRGNKFNNYELTKHILCEVALVDWKLPTDPSDPKAKPVPFTVPNALEYFSMDDTKWICNKLYEWANDASYFKASDDDTSASAEDVAGN